MEPSAVVFFALSTFWLVVVLGSALRRHRDRAELQGLRELVSRIDRIAHGARETERSLALSVIDEIDRFRQNVRSEEVGHQVGDHSFR
jgi:hypothetical protein